MTDHHFGFEKVDSAEKKTEKVQDVFTSVASNYDIMNDLMSLGLHRLWKRRAIKMTNLRPGEKALDLAAGSGDLTIKIAKAVGKTGTVVASDLNNAMLSRGRDRLLDEGHAEIKFAQADAQYLPFADNTFDCVTIAFGLRNVTDQQMALDSIFRVLKPGGRLIILEFSKLRVNALKSIYDTYSFSILPKIGQLIAKDADSYRYLAESIRMHPDQETLQSMMGKSGFEMCNHYNLSGGIVAIHRGYKL